MDNTPKPISRRKFLSRSGKTVSGIAAAAALGSSAMTRPAKAKVLGANDRINAAVIGFRSRGRTHIKTLAKLPGVKIATLCDIDENIYPKNVKMVQDGFGYEPATEWDMRKVFDDKDIDVVSFATPNHWHVLGTIWAIQAGKHVYVEKPASHNIWEGRKMVEAAKKYNKVVQVGFQNRSKPSIKEAIRKLKEGIIGDVYMARGLCFKPRGNIGMYPDSPKPAGVHYDRWIGPAPKKPFNKNRFHYNWHWHWDYGNGDIGNQGPHQFDIARWGLQKNEHPVKIRSMGGRFVWENCSQETANTQAALYEYADGKVLQFEVRGLYTNTEAGDWYGDYPIGNLFFGSEGWMAIKNDDWFTYFGRKNEPGPTSKKEQAEKSADNSAMNLLGPVSKRIFANFIDAVRKDDPSILDSYVESGHMSSCLPHLANISYRLGRDLVFDGKNECFVNDKEADTLLTRKYRAPYVVPEKV